MTKGQGQAECQKDEDKQQEEEVQSEPNPSPQQSLTKQEQFGEVWKERESTRLGRGVWAEEAEGPVEGSEWRDSWRKDARGRLYFPTYL